VNIYKCLKVNIISLQNLSLYCVVETKVLIMFECMSVEESTNYLYVMQPCVLDYISVS